MYRRSPCRERSRFRTDLSARSMRTTVSILSRILLPRVKYRRFPLPRTSDASRWKWQRWCTHPLDAASCWNQRKPSETRARICLLVSVGRVSIASYQASNRSLPLMSTGSRKYIRWSRTGFTAIRYSTHSFRSNLKYTPSTMSAYGPFGNGGGGVATYVRSACANRAATLTSCNEWKFRHSCASVCPWNSMRFKRASVCLVRFRPRFFFLILQVRLQRIHCLLRLPKRRTGALQQGDFACCGAIHANYAGKT